MFNHTVLNYKSCITSLLIGSSVLITHPVFADEKFGDWSVPVNLEMTDSGINTSAREGCQVLSPDGLSLYFASDQPDTSRDASRTDLDLWVAEREAEDRAFSQPYNLGAVINSTGDEVCPTISKNGTYLYFASNRVGTCGDRDLYISERQNVNDNLNWQLPQNLGCEINSASRDHGATYFKFKKQHAYLYFSSNRLTDNPDYLGHNVYEVKIGQDGLPILSTLKILKGISSTNSDSRPFLRKDGLEIFFDRDIKDGNREDLWFATRHDFSDIFSNAQPIPTLKSTGRDIRPALNEDATTLYFTSTRKAGSLGRADIWVSKRIEIEDEDNDDD